MVSGLKIYCKTLLQGEQWLDNAVLDLDSNGLIRGIQPGTPQTADSSINGIVIPGMPNAHSHSFQRVIAGLTGPRGNDGDSFWSWREAMYRAANSLSPQQFAAVARWVFTEMLKAGFTSCAEFHYLHHQPTGQVYSDLSEMSSRLIDAAVESGISMTLLPVLYCTAGFGKTHVSQQQQRFYNPADRYLRLLESCKTAIESRPLIELGMAPHSLRAVPGPVLQEVLQSWPEKNYPVHIHIAEQPAEIDDCIAHLGARPVDWLLDNFDVDERWCLVHATHMSDEELRRCAASQAIAGLCPTTEADLGDGVFKTLAWLNSGGRFAIGSDSNVRISIAEELRLLEYNERLRSGRRNVLATPTETCGRFLYQHAASTGAVAMGQAVGRLEPGKRADLLVLDDDHELLNGRQADAALDTWIFAGDNSMLKSVWVAGRQVVENGCHVTDTASRSGFMQTLKEIQNA